MKSKSAMKLIHGRMEAARKGMEADLDTLDRISAEAGKAHGEAGKHLAAARDRFEKDPTEDTAEDLKRWGHAESGLFATAGLGKAMRQSYKEMMR